MEMSENGNNDRKTEINKYYGGLKRKGPDQCDIMLIDKECQSGFQYQDHIY